MLESDNNLVHVSYLFHIGESGFFRDVRDSITQQLTSALTCVIQCIPHITKNHTVWLSWRYCLPELCIELENIT